MRSFRRKLPHALIALCMPLTLWAQSTVTGTVRSKQQEPVVGAHVGIPGLAIATATDATGHYRLTVPAAKATGQVVVRVTALGYAPASHSVTLTSGAITQDFTLFTVALGLEGVVVTALGVQREQRSLGYAVQTVSGASVAQAPVASVIDALAGKAAGVVVTSSGGRPGASSRIVLRGESSFLGNSQPLFVIDGVPISNDVDHNASGSFNLDAGQMTNRGIDIDPNSIESVSILRGAAASALYGSRAANGVILITTKRGTGKMTLNFSSRVSTDTPIWPKYQTTYLGGVNGFYTNGIPIARGGYVQPGYPGTNPVTLSAWGPDKNNVDPSVLAALGVTRIPTYNPLKDFYQNGREIDNSANISGKISDGSYYLGVTRENQTGITPNSDFGRTSVTANISTTVGSKLSSQTNVMFTQDGNDYLGDGYYGPQRWLSVAPISYDSKEPFFSDGTPRSTGADAFWLAQNEGYTSNVNRLIAGQFLSLALPHSLSLADRVGIDTYTDQRSFHTNFRPWATGASGSMWDQKIVRTNLNNDLTLNLSPIELRRGLTLSGLLGNNISSDGSRSVQINGSGINIPSYYNVSNFNQVTGSNSRVQQKLIGMYGQASLAYHNYLFLQGTARNDWSSTLPSNANSYFYPSVSLGYVFTDALGLKNRFFDYGKLRASWARVGNSAPPYSLSTGYYRAGYSDFPNADNGISFSLPFNGVNGYALSTSLGNPTLKPELTTEKELGVDLRFFGGRASAEITTYDKSTHDQIFAVPSSAATGYTSILRNAGDLRNRGLEISLGGTPVQLKDFSWELRANWSRNHSSVISLAPGVNNIYLAGYSYPQIRIMQGFGYGVIWGFDYERNDKGQVLIDDSGMPIPSRTLSALGNVQPKWTGNLESTITLGELSLSGLIDVRKGGDILNFEGWYTIPNGTAKVTEQRNDMYVVPGVNATTGQPNTTPVLRNRAYYTAYATAVQTNLVEDGGYVKLRELTLSYALPARLLRGTRAQAASVFLTGHNLLTHSNFSGGDPEGNTVGSDNPGGAALHFFNTPTTRSFGFGLRATF